MQLKLKRSQRSAGMLGGKVMYMLDARAELTGEEKALVSKHGLGKQTVYDSEARKKRMESAGDHRLAMLGAVAGLVSEDGVSVGGFDAVAVSYPGFSRDLAALGAVPA